MGSVRIFSIPIRLIDSDALIDTTCHNLVQKMKTRHIFFLLLLFFAEITR